MAFSGQKYNTTPPHPSQSMGSMVKSSRTAFHLHRIPAQSASGAFLKADDGVVTASKVLPDHDPGIRHQMEIGRIHIRIAKHLFFAREAQGGNETGLPCPSLPLMITSSCIPVSFTCLSAFSLLPTAFCPLFPFPPCLARRVSGSAHKAGTNFSFHSGITSTSISPFE